MKSFSVLVIGSSANRHLSDCLLDLGFVPVFRPGIEGALRALRSGPQAAVVLDECSCGVDWVELVLNVREFSGKVPVVVIAAGDVPRNQAVLRQLPNTFLLGGTDNEQRLSAKLDEVLAGSAVSNAE